MYECDGDSANRPELVEIPALADDLGLVLVGSLAYAMSVSLETPSTPKGGCEVGQGKDGTDGRKVTTQAWDAPRKHKASTRLDKNRPSMRVEIIQQRHTEHPILIRSSDKGPASDYQKDKNLHVRRNHCRYTVTPYSVLRTPNRGTGKYLGAALSLDLRGKKSVYAPGRAQYSRRNLPSQYGVMLFASSQPI